MEHLDAKLRGQVTRTMRATMRAPEVAALGAPADMTPTEVRIARDAMTPQRECPAYIIMAQRIWEAGLRARTLQERDPAPKLNVETIQVAVSNTYVYEYVEDPASKK